MDCIEKVQSGKNFPLELKRHGIRGDIFIGYKKSTIKQITSGKFLEELIDELSKTIKKSYADNNDHPAFRSETKESEMEKMHSEIEKTLKRLQWNYKHELQIERINRKTGKGWLDFIIKKDDYAYAVEVKVCHKGYAVKSPLSEIKIRKYVDAVQQIKNTIIVKLPDFCKGVKTIMGIALLFIVFNSTSEKELSTNILHLDVVRKKIKNLMRTIDSSATETQKSYLKDCTFEARWFLASDIVMGKSHKGKLQGDPKIFPCLCAIAQTDFDVIKAKT